MIATADLRGALDTWIRTRVPDLQVRGDAWRAYYAGWRLLLWVSAPRDGRDSIDLVWWDGALGSIRAVEDLVDDGALGVRLRTAFASSTSNRLPGNTVGALGDGSGTVPADSGAITYGAVAVAAVAVAAAAAREIHSELSRPREYSPLVAAMDAERRWGHRLRIPAPPRDRAAIAVIAIVLWGLIVLLLGSAALSGR